MAEKIPFLEPAGLRVTVDQVVFTPNADREADRPYCFVYFISIHNDSEDEVTIKGRKWVVTNDNGQTVVVEGDGVVGKFPIIAPGGHFTYNSFHMLGTRRGRAEGSYFGLDAKGRRVMTRIPAFDLEVPEGE